MRLSVPHVILLLIYYSLLPDTSAYTRHRNSFAKNSDLIPWAEVPQFYKVLIDEADNDAASSPRSDLISRKKSKQGNTDAGDFGCKSLDDEEEGQEEKKKSGANEKKNIFNINRFLPFALTTKLSQWRNSQSDKDEDREAKDLKKTLRHQDSFNLDCTPAPDRLKSEEDQDIPDRLQAAPKVLLSLINTNPRLVSKLLKKLFNSSTRPQKFKLPPLEPPDDSETNFFIAPKAKLAYKQPLYTETGQNVEYETEQLINSQSVTAATSSGFTDLTSQNSFLTNKIDLAQSSTELTSDEVSISTGSSYTDLNFEESLTGERQIESKPIGKSFEKPQSTTANPGQESHVQEVESILKTVMEILAILNKTEESSTSASNILKSLARDANIVDNDREGECKYTNDGKPKDAYEFSDEDLNKVLKLVINMAEGTSKLDDDSANLGELVSAVKTTENKSNSVEEGDENLNNVEGETIRNTVARQSTKQGKPNSNNFNLLNLMNKLADQDDEVDIKLEAADQKDDKFRGEDVGVSYKEVAQTHHPPNVMLDKPIISEKEKEPNRWEEVSSAFTATTEPSILINVPLNCYKEVVKLINKLPSESENATLTLQSSEKYDLKKADNSEPLVYLQDNVINNEHSCDSSSGTSSLEESWLDNDVLDDYKNQDTSLFGLGADQSKTLEAISSVSSPPVRNSTLVGFSEFTFENSTVNDFSLPAVQNSSVKALSLPAVQNLTLAAFSPSNSQNSTSDAFIHSGIENSTVRAFTAPAEQNSPVVAFSPPTMENATSAAISSPPVEKTTVFAFASTLNVSFVIKDEGNVDSATQRLDLVKSNVIENVTLLAHSKSKKKNHTTEEEKASVAKTSRKLALKNSTPKKQSLFNKIFCSLFGSSASSVKGKKLSTNSSNATLNDNRELMEIGTGASSATGGTTTLLPVLGHQISNKNEFNEYLLTEKGKSDLAFLKYIPGAFRVDEGKSKSSVGINRVHDMAESSSPKETIFVKGNESDNKTEMSIQIPLPISSLKTLSHAKTDSKSFPENLLLTSSDENPSIVNKVVAQTETHVNLLKDISRQQDSIHGNSNYYLLSTEHSKHRHSTIQSQLKLVAGKEKNHCTVSGFTLPIGESPLPVVSTLANNYVSTTSTYEASFELITAFNETLNTNESVTDDEQRHTESSTNRDSFSSSIDELQATDTAGQPYEDATTVISSHRRVSGHRDVETETLVIGNVPAVIVPKVNVTWDVSTDVNRIQSFESISEQGELLSPVQSASWNELSPLEIIESTENVTKSHESNHTRVYNITTEDTPSSVNVVNNPSKDDDIPRDEIANIKIYLYDPPFEEAYSYTTCPISSMPTTETTPTNWEKRFQEKLMPIPYLQLIDRPSQHNPIVLEASDGVTDSANIQLVNLPIRTWDTTPIPHIEMDQTSPASSLLHSMNPVSRKEKFFINNKWRSQMGRVLSEKNKTNTEEQENNSHQTSGALHEHNFPIIPSAVESNNVTKMILDNGSAFEPSYDGRGIEYRSENNSTNIFHDNTVCIGEVEDATNAVTLIDKTTESDPELENKLKNENSPIQYTDSADDRKTHHNAFSTPPVYVVHNFIKDSTELSRKVMWKWKKTTYPALAEVDMATKPTQVPVNHIVTPELGSKSQSYKEDYSNATFFNDFMEALNKVLKVENGYEQSGELLDVPTISIAPPSVFIDKTRTYTDSIMNPITPDAEISTLALSGEVPMLGSDQSPFTNVVFLTEPAVTSDTQAAEAAVTSDTQAAEAAVTSDTQAAEAPYPDLESQNNSEVDITSLLTPYQSTECSDVTPPSTLNEAQQNLNREDKFNLVVNTSKLQDKESIGPSLMNNNCLNQTENPDLYAVLNWTRSDNTSFPLGSSDLSLDGNMRMRNSSTWLEKPFIIGKAHFGRHYFPGIRASLNNKHRYHKFRALLQNRHYSDEDDKRQGRLSETLETNDVTGLGSGEVSTNLTKCKRNPAVKSIIPVTVSPNQIVVHRFLTTQYGGRKVTMSPGFYNLAEKMTGNNEAEDKEAELRAFMGQNTTRTQSPTYRFNINDHRENMNMKFQPLLLSKGSYGFTTERPNYKPNLRMRLNGFVGTTPPPLFQLHNYLNDGRSPEVKDPHQIFNIYILNKAKNSQNPSASNSTHKITTTSQSPFILNQAKNKKNPFYKRMNIFRKFGLCREGVLPEPDKNLTTGKIDENNKLNGTVRVDIACLTSEKPELKTKLDQVTPVNFKVTSTEKVASKPTKQGKLTGTSLSTSVTVASSVEGSLSPLINVNSSSNCATTFSYSAFQNVSATETVIRASEALGNATYVTPNLNSYFDPPSYNRWSNGSQIDPTGKPYVLWIPQYRYKIYNDYLDNKLNRTYYINSTIEMTEDKNLNLSTPNNKLKQGFKITNIFSLKGNQTEKSPSKGSYNVTTNQIGYVNATSAFLSTTRGVLPDKALHHTTQVYTGLGKINSKTPTLYSYNASSIANTTEGTPGKKHKSQGFFHKPGDNSTLRSVPCTVNKTNQISAIYNKNTTEHFTENIYPANTSYFRYYDSTTKHFTENIYPVNATYSRYYDSTTEHFTENIYPANTSYSRYYDSTTEHFTENIYPANTSYSRYYDSTTEHFTENIYPANTSYSRYYDSTTEHFTENIYPANTSYSSYYDSTTEHFTQNIYPANTSYSSYYDSTTEHFTENIYPANTSYSKYSNSKAPGKERNLTESNVENTSSSTQFTMDLITVPSPVHVVSSLWNKQELSCTASEDANANLPKHNYSERVTSSTAQYNLVYFYAANSTDKSLPTNVSSIYQTTCLQPLFKAEISNTLPSSVLHDTSDIFETTALTYTNVTSKNIAVESYSTGIANKLNTFSSGSEKIVDERLEIGTTSGPLYSEAVYVPNENGFERPSTVSVSHSVKDTEHSEFHIGTTVFSTKDFVVSATLKNVVSLEDIKESTNNMLITDDSLKEVTTKVMVQETTIGGVNEAAFDKPSTSVDSYQLMPAGRDTEDSSSQTSPAVPDMEDLPSVTSLEESLSTVRVSNSSNPHFMDEIIDVVGQDIFNGNVTTQGDERSAPTDTTETFNIDGAVDLTNEQMNSSSATTLPIISDNATAAASNEETLDLDSVLQQTPNLETFDSSESDFITDSTEETGVNESFENNDSINEFSTQESLVLTPNPEINLELIDSDPKIIEKSSNLNLKVEEGIPANDKSENTEVTLESEDRGENSSTDDVLTLNDPRSKAVRNGSKYLEINGNYLRNPVENSLKQVNDSQHAYEKLFSISSSYSIPENGMVGALEKVTKWSLFEGSRVSTQCTLVIEDTTCPLTTEQTTCEESHSDQSTTVDTTCETTCEATDETTCEATDETTCETTDEISTCETTCETTPDTACSSDTTGLDEFDFNFNQKYGHPTTGWKIHSHTKASYHDDHPTKKKKKKKGKGQYSTTPSACSTPVYSPDEGILSSESEFWRTLSTAACANSVTKRGKLKNKNKKSDFCLNLINPGDSVDGKNDEIKNSKETVDDNPKTSVKNLNDNGNKIGVKVINSEAKYLHASVSTNTEESNTSNDLSMNLDLPDHSGDVENPIKTATEPLGLHQFTVLFPLVTEFSSESADRPGECESTNIQSLSDKADDNHSSQSGDAAALGKVERMENDGENSGDYDEGRAPDDSPEYSDVGFEDLTDTGVDRGEEATDIHSSSDESNEESIAKKVYFMSILNNGTNHSKSLVTPFELDKTYDNAGNVISSLSLNQTDFKSIGLVNSLEGFVSSAKSKKSIAQISGPKATIFALDPSRPEAPIDEIRPNAIGPGRQSSGLSTTHRFKETKGVTSPSVGTKNTCYLKRAWSDETQQNKPCSRSLDSESDICSTLSLETMNLPTSTDSGLTQSLTKINSSSVHFSKPQIGRNNLTNTGSKNKGHEPSEWRADQSEQEFSMPEDHKRPESHSLSDRIWEVLSKAVKVQSYNPHSVEKEKPSDLWDFNSSQTDKSANDSKTGLLHLPKSANSIFINENTISKAKNGTGKNRKEVFEQKNRGRKIFGWIQKEFNNSKIYNDSDMNYYLSKIQIPSVDEVTKTITAEPKALLLSSTSSTVLDEIERTTKPSTNRTIADLLKIDPLLRYILDLGSARTNKPLISEPISNTPADIGGNVNENTFSEKEEKRFSKDVNNVTANTRSVMDSEFESWDDLVDQFRDPILNYDYSSDSSGHCGQDNSDIQGKKGRRISQEKHSGLVSGGNGTLSHNGSKQESGLFKIGCDTDGQFVDSDNFNNFLLAPNFRFIGLNASDNNSYRKKKSRTEGYLFAKDGGKFEKEDKNKIYEFSMGTYRPIQVRTKRKIDLNGYDTDKDDSVRSKRDDGENKKSISKDVELMANRAVRSRPSLRKIQEVFNPWEGGKKGNCMSVSERRKIAKILEAIESNSLDDSDDVLKCMDLSSSKKIAMSKPRNIKVETKNALPHKVKQCRRKQGYLLNNWGKDNKTVVYPYFSEVENPIKGKCIGSRPNTLSYNISESFFDKGDNGTALLCHVDLKITTKNYTLAPDSADDERGKYSCFYYSPTAGWKPNVFVQYSPVYQSETNFSHAPHDYTTFLVKRVHKSLDQEYKYVVINLNNIFYITVELNGDVYTYSDRTTPLGSRTVAKKPGRRKKNYKYLPTKKRKNKNIAVGSEPKKKRNKIYLPRKRIKLDLTISDRPP